MHSRCSTEIPAQKKRKIEDVDRISDLPDSILICILSFLSTKEAVQTSLLAKRFQHLWASVPVLNFDFDEFIPDGITSEDLEEDEDNLGEYEEKFANFVEAVFEHREPLNLDLFKLVWNEEEGDPTPATSWLDTVAKLKPKSISVRIFTENDTFEVPDSVFACESLQELVLYLGFEDISPRSIKLPCLKKLTLDSVDIVDEVIQKLSSLPAIEELVLRYCHVDRCDISSSTLKRLVLDSYHNDTTPPDLSISTPSLLCLEVRSWSTGRIKFKNLQSLVKAHIHFQEYGDEEPLFVMGLSNVTYLELVLCRWDILGMKDELERETSKFPAFDNLRTLKIGEWCMTGDFDLVAHFLLHAPNLEKLTLLHHQPQATGSRLETSLGSGDEIDILEINDRKTDKSASEIVNSIHKHLKAIRGTISFPPSSN